MVRTHTPNIDMQKLILKESELEGFAEKIIAKLKNNCILLQGDLGAGKTRLTQCIAEKLSVKETVLSPTFVILKEYKTKHERFKKLLHMDAYRLDGSDDIRAFKIEDLLKDESSLLVIEWPEKLKMDFEACVKVKIRYINEKEREFELKF